MSLHPSVKQNLSKQLFKIKDLNLILQESHDPEKRLKKALSAFDLILLGIGVAIFEILVIAGLTTRRRVGTTVNNFSPPSHENCRCALTYKDRPEYPDNADDA